MGPPRTTDWDGPTYDRVSAPQQEWAQKVMEERLPLEGGEAVLDAGCGSGRVTKMLLDRLPEGRVIGVDGSPSMIETARETLAGEDRVTLIVSDLLEVSPELLRRSGAETEADAVFSNATFHWIRDHEALFRALRSVMRPGARLVAQCGGRGNVAEWVAAIKRVIPREPYAEHLADVSAWNFYGPEETEERLRAAGFEEIRTWLSEVPPVLPDDPRAFVTTVGLAAHMDRLPKELREPFTDDVIDELPQPLELRYIRLNIDAVASASA
jgi:trans-aconitate 2-methyltransferase